MHADIEVRAIQLPGRGARLAEPPCTSFPHLVRTIAGLLDEGDEVPFAFFGHSLGGVLAFEVARYCAKHGLPKPWQLFVSGSPAPQQRGESRNLHLLPEDELIDLLRGFQGTPPAVLASRELMQLLLPTIRADFSLVEGYRYSNAPLLEVPIIAFAGRDDEISVSQMQAWERETSQDFQLHWFDGGHFFINAHREQIAELISEEMLGLLVD
jgi:medium-chain acyl-[acyl-carrier-protein] hydrolase